MGRLSPEKRMKKKKESLILGSILEKIAPSLGATVHIEPRWRVVGQITFKSGNRSYFRYNTLDLNPVGSSDVAKDKDYANFFMEELGYRIVPGSKAFFSDHWAKVVHATDRSMDAAYAHARSLGFPVIVKPNSGSQGRDVALVHTKKELYQAMRRIFRSDHIALIQQCVRGKDYRLVVLDESVVSAYERIPLGVTGDGRSNIAELLQRKQEQFEREKRDTAIDISDPRITQKLARQERTCASIPHKGEWIQLLDNANLSSGGTSVDVTETVHPDFKKLAVSLTRDMGLRFCGVDLMIEGSIEEKPAAYWILEINAAPGLDHYAKIGRAQEKIVEDLYLKVLKHLEH